MSVNERNSSGFRATTVHQSIRMESTADKLDYSRTITITNIPTAMDACVNQSAYAPPTYSPLVSPMDTPMATPAMSNVTPVVSPPPIHLVTPVASPKLRRRRIKKEEKLETKAGKKVQKASHKSSLIGKKNQKNRFHLPAEQRNCTKAAHLASLAEDRGKNHVDRFVCDRCGKEFKRRYNLKVHLRTHTGELPYQCRVPGCGKKFKWRSSMAHHSNTHSKDELEAAEEMQGEDPPTSPVTEGVRDDRRVEESESEDDGGSETVSEYSAESVVYDPVTLVSAPDAHFCAFPMFQAVQPVTHEWRRDERGNEVLQPVRRDMGFYGH